MSGAGAEGHHGGRLLAGRYRVVEVLGRGGMGMVCRAVDEVLGREVAVKELRTYTDASGEELADLRLRMQREARAAARIRHPGVIAVHDVAEQDGRPVIVMELVDGPSLDGVLQERGVLDPCEAAAIGAEVAGALGAAHAAGVLHRDVKPGNVLLEHGGRVVLTDFGIATVDEPGDGTSADLTRSGQLVGSLDFIAPERAQGQRPGPASDLWSLGAMLYAAVEGNAPFRRTAPWSTLAAIVGEPLPEPVRAGALAPVLRELLEKDPAARPDAQRARRLLEAVARGPAEAVSGDGSKGRPAARPGEQETPRQPAAPQVPQPAHPVGVPPFSPAAAGAVPFPAASQLRTTRPEPGWRPPVGVVGAARQEGAPGGTGDGGAGNGAGRRLAVAASVGAMLLLGGGVAWAMAGGSGHGGGNRPLARQQPSIGSIPAGAAGRASQGAHTGSTPSAGRPSTVVSSASKGGTSRPGSGGSTGAGGTGGAGSGGTSSGSGGSGNSAPPTSTPEPPSADPGYVPDSLAATDGCAAWLDYRVSGTGGFAMGTLESAGNSCEMHFFRSYPSDAKSSQNLNSTHTISGSGKQSTDWYWDGGDYYAGVCVWEVGHYSDYSCGGRYYVVSGKPVPQ